VHLFGCTKRIYYNARTCERQIHGHLFLGHAENIKKITGTGILSQEALSQYVELFFVVFR